MAGLKTSPTVLGDFRTNSRMLVLIGLALPVGAISAFVAKALLWLIAEITNLVFFQRFSSELGSLQHNHLGAWVILAPVAGALVIALMACYGSEKIRGQGIREALEAILLGGSSIEPRVAVLKPISSAISIGTGGPFGAEGLITMTGGAFGLILALRNEEGELAGIITRGDVVRAFERSGDSTVTVSDVGSTNLIVAYRDETLHDAIARMQRHDVGRLSVVDRANEKRVVGYLGRASIMAARERYHRDEQLRERGVRKPQLTELPRV